MYDICWKKKKTNDLKQILMDGCFMWLFYFFSEPKEIFRKRHQESVVCVWLAGCELVCVVHAASFLSTCLHIQREKESVSVVLCALWNTSKIMYDESFEWFKCISKMCALCAAGYVVSRNMINVLMNRMRLNYILKLCLWMCELFASIYLCIIYFGNCAAAAAAVSKMYEYCVRLS